MQTQKWPQPEVRQNNKWYIAIWTQLVNLVNPPAVPYMPKDGKINSNGTLVSLLIAARLWLVRNQNQPKLTFSPFSPH